MQQKTHLGPSLAVTQSSVVSLLHKTRCTKGGVRAGVMIGGIDYPVSLI
jgi:hypothetical protein